MGVIHPSSCWRFIFFFPNGVLEQFIDRNACNQAFRTFFKNRNGYSFPRNAISWSFHWQVFAKVEEVDYEETSRTMLFVWEGTSVYMFGDAHTYLFSMQRFCIFCNYSVYMWVHVGILWIIQAPLVCMFLRISLPHLTLDPGNRNGNRKFVERFFYFHRWSHWMIFSILNTWSTCVHFLKTTNALFFDVFYCPIFIFDNSSRKPSVFNPRPSMYGIVTTFTIK